MKRDPHKPRYRAPEKRTRQPKGKERPLDLTPEHPGRGWARSFANVLLTAIVPTILLWWWTVTLSSYRVVFANAVSDVRLDGKPVRLNYRNGFEIPRTPLGDHRLQYRDAQGQDVELALHPSALDNDARPLTIDGARIDGAPRAEITSSL